MCSPRFPLAPRRTGACHVVALGLLVLGSFVLSRTAAAVPGAVSDDGLWTELSPADPRATSPSGVRTGVSRAYHLDLAAFDALASSVPAEDLAHLATSGMLLTLPMPNGDFARFRIQESPILSPQLQAEHPELRTFIGQGVDDPLATARLDRTPLGFHAQVLSADGTVLVDPVALDDIETYISLDKESRGTPPFFQCGVTEVAPAILVPAAPSGSQLRTYRLVMTGTGEYTQFFGSIAAANAGITTTVNRVTGIYEREVAIRLNIVFFNTYADPTTDPFGNPSNVNGTLLNENQADIDANFGAGNYDVGHLVNNGGGGGLAGLGVVCTGSKSRGATSLSPPVGDNYDVDYVAHEMGHQFGGDHTFNGTTSNCGGGNRVASSAYEPGSGTTIMAYAGICGAEDVAPHSDPFFHTRSFDQITAFREGTGVCGAASATGNGVPTVNAGSDYTIPRNTPFKLTGSGSDPDSHPLTFCWEQFDLGTASPPANNADGPMFRFRPPTTSPSRTFPRLSTVLSGVADPWERLPTADRTMAFRLTARDNRAGGGGVNYDDMLVTVSGAPFAVTSPNGGETLVAGCTSTVTWDVGGSLSLAANVSISISTNGGTTFTTLIASTANDGSEVIDVPCTATSQGRIMVEAVGNVFFDVSNANFSIVRIPPVVAVTATGGAVDANCERLVTFSGTASDDCALLAADVSIAASLPFGGATIGVPTVSKVQVDATHVTVSGSVLVSALVGPPAIVRIDLTAADVCGASSTTSDTGIVFDDTPPTLALSPSRDTLWPPNHEMAPIHVTAVSVDNCDATPTIVLVSIVSNEPDDDIGDGHFTNDIQEADFGTSDFDFLLRSERMGPRNGRKYTITYTATDNSGNSTTAQTQVKVSHDQSGHALAALGFASDGSEFESDAQAFVIVIPSKPAVALPAADGDELRRAGGTTPVSEIPGFSAAALDPRRVCVGNLAGLIAPERSLLYDVDDDGLQDLICAYSRESADALRGSGGELAIRYVTKDGKEFLIPSLFQMGEPVTLPPTVIGSIGVGIEGRGGVATDPDPTIAPTEAGDRAAESRETRLIGVHPNPLQMSSRISFSLAREENVGLAVYNLQGARVRTLAKGTMAAGRHEVDWDIRDASGRPLPAGAYFVRFDAGAYHRTVRVAVIP